MATKSIIPHPQEASAVGARVKNGLVVFDDSQRGVDCGGLYGILERSDLGEGDLTSVVEKLNELDIGELQCFVQEVRHRSLFDDGMSAFFKGENIPKNFRTIGMQRRLINLAWDMEAGLAVVGRNEREREAVKWVVSRIRKQYPVGILAIRKLSAMNIRLTAEDYAGLMRNILPILGKKIMSGEKLTRAQELAFGKFSDFAKEAMKKQTAGAGGVHNTIAIQNKSENGESGVAKFVLAGNKKIQDVAGEIVDKNAPVEIIQEK